MEKDKLRKWLETGKYLPPILRDFHDQKDFFKYVSQCVTRRHKHAQENNESTHPYEDFDWCRFHILVVDFFLWYMAMNGYTLQKSRQQIPFRDYDETIKASQKEWQESFSSIYNKEK